MSMTPTRGELHLCTRASGCHSDEPPHNCEQARVNWRCEFHSRIATMLLAKGVSSKNTRVDIPLASIVWMFQSLLGPVLVTQLSQPSQHCAQ